jgi:hypothetical protein
VTSFGLFFPGFRSNWTYKLTSTLCGSGDLLKVNALPHMGFYETPHRRLRIIRACGNFVLAGVIAALPIFVSVDTLGHAFCFAVVTIFTLIGAVNLRLSQRTASDATVTLIPDRAPILEQVRYFRRYLWLSALSFPLMTIWIAHDLHQLEIGAMKEVRIMAPVGFLYEHFGYWTAVLYVPVLGLLCCAFFMLRLRKLSRQDPT